MARRSDHSREELYEMAMQEARRIVTEYGWRKLTARMLSKCMGYSVGTLYNLFGNIDDLILHMNGMTLDQLSEALAQVSLNGHPVEDMERLLACYLGFLQTHTALWVVLLEHSLPEGQNLPDWYLEKINRLLSHVEQAISPLFEDADKNACRESAATIWAALHGIGSLAGADKLDVITQSSFEEMALNFIRTYLAGLK